MHDSQHRLPRYTRCQARVFRVTERDVEIVRAVERHHFLSSSHLAALIGGSGQQLRRRLQLLFHHRYLERPRAQLEYFGRAGSQPMIYGLGNKGARLLAEQDNRPYDSVDWSYKNTKIRRVFLEHTLGIADVMIAFELACRHTSRVTLIDQKQVIEAAPQTTRNAQNPLRFSATVHVRDAQERLALVPDQAFSMEYQTRCGAERANFFLELDRGTMPVKRRSLRGSSIFKKMLTYHAGWRQKQHTTQFGWKYFRVLTVTNSPERVAHMVSTGAALNDGRGSRMFLFADTRQLSEHSILDVSWLDGCGNIVKLSDN